MLPTSRQSLNFTFARQAVIVHCYICFNHTCRYCRNVITSVHTTATICSDEANMSEMVLPIHFCKFLVNPSFISNLTKSSKRQSEDASNDIFSVWKYCQLFTHNEQCAIQINRGENSPKPPFPLAAHRPHLIHQFLGRPHSPVTTPNNSSIGSCTSTQLCNEVPIGYSGIPQIHPQNCSFPFDNHHPYLIHPSLNRPHSSSQTASRSTQPFSHRSLSGQTDRRQTNRWSRQRSTVTESDVLIILLMQECGPGL